MIHPVLTLTRNCLPLTKNCVTSVFKQTIPTKLYVYDNGSTDGTVQWLTDQIVAIDRQPENQGVSKGWNDCLKTLMRKNEHVLVINNDVVLPPWFYESLLSYDVPFVTGVGVDNYGAIEVPAERFPLQPCPDFSAFLIHREAWIKIGPFDESMKFYAQDVDYHIRGAKMGVPMMKANVPYFHAGSATLRNSTELERINIRRQAEADRYTFRQKWGFCVGSKEHHAAVGFAG